jgi:hypothetical protein
MGNIDSLSLFYMTVQQFPQAFAPVIALFQDFPQRFPDWIGVGLRLGAKPTYGLCFYVEWFFLLHFSLPGVWVVVSGRLAFFIPLESRL